MYIIPQNIKFETKKLLKFKLSKILDNLTDSFLDNLFYSGSDNKYQNMMLNLDENIRKAVLKAFKETIQIIDKIYCNSKERKQHFNISAHAKRSIVTIFGWLDIERIYYYDKYNKNSYFCFIDELFNFPKYDRYDKIVKGMAIQNAIQTNQKKGAELTNDRLNSCFSSFNNTRQVFISRQDIYLWIDKWNVPNIEYDAIETDSDTLYIMIDEKYIHEQIKNIIGKNEAKTETTNSEKIKGDILAIAETLIHPKKQLLLPPPKKKSKHFIMSKAFITFTGIHEDHKRRTLENRTVFLTTSKNPWDEFMDCIPKIYDFSNYKNIKVLSDAGSWILSGIHNLKLYADNIITPCLCEFHVKQKINRSTKDENLRKRLYQCIENDDKTEFNKIYKELMKDKPDSRIKTLKAYKHYIIAHWNAIKEMKKSKYKSSMESHISHNVAKYFSYEPKAYSSRKIPKLIKLVEYHANGINILDLYLRTCNNDKNIIIKKEELNFAIFENSSPSNIPLLYNCSSLTSIALRGLAHP